VEPTLLEFKNIDFSYPHHGKNEPSVEFATSGNRLAAQKTLCNVGFNIERGERVVLLGANGSGKSTLAKLANGLLLPTDGQVVVDGISSWQHDYLLELRKNVGLVTQDPDNQIVSTTVFDEVAFGPQNLGWKPKRIYETVSQSLEHVGLSEDVYAGRDPNSLSGGEKQRVVIAALLAMQPNYLVLDEPTSMLDPAARMQVLKAIASAAKRGQGILHITHRLEEAVKADRVLILYRGRLCYNGKPEDILGNKEALIRFGLRAQLHVRRASEVAEPIKHSSLTLSDVSFSYPNSPSKLPVFEDMNLELKAGECHLLVGASGSGKSTLLTLAAGLAKPSKGTVLLDDNTPLPGEVGLVFQHPESQLFAQTIKEDILFGPRNLGMQVEEAGDALVNRVLTLVGLDPDKFRHRSPFSLSGGEARRVAIATVLALGTDFFLLDEPTAGLDARGRVFIFELLQSLLAKGKGIMVATHDPEFFLPLATGRREL